MVSGVIGWYSMVFDGINGIEYIVFDGIRWYSSIGFHRGVGFFW